MTAAASLCRFVVRSPQPAAIEGWHREAFGLEAGAVELRVEHGPDLPARATEPIRLMPNIVVPDAAATERRLVAMGATWIRELETTRWGRIATVLDPDGNYVQLFEVPS